MRPRRAHFSIIVQGIGTLFAIVAMTMWPPASGRMLLVPLTGTDPNIVAKTALSGGAMLLGSGPFRGSLVVVGDRSRIMRVLPSWNIVVTAAPPAGCGTADPPGVAA